MAISTRLYLFYLFDKNYSQNRKQEMESKILGERLKQVRRLLGLTQKDLSTATQLSQTSISRLENGDEVYASVLLSVLCYYQKRVSLDYMLSQDFDATSNRLFQRSTEEVRQKLADQIQRITDSLKLSTQAYTQQLEFLKDSL
jgi:transcriptional regulator with XRE-family HTH domain